MANTWSGLNQQDDIIWENWFDQYVPSSGKASSIGGEIVRAMTRVLYRFYNDGDQAGIDYGNETVNSSDRYLVNIIPDYESPYGIADERCYEETMLENHRKVFQFLRSHLGLFNEPNEFDSREASDEDYAYLDEYEDDDCEDYSDYDYEDIEDEDFGEDDYERI